MFLPRAADQSYQAPAADGRLHHRGGVILLADEQDASRSLAARTLRELGYQVIEAGNGRIALTLTYSVAAVDLAVISTTLGEVGGTDLAARLHIERPKLPVLFLAGHRSSDTPDALDTPDPATLIRPYNARDLVAAIRAGLADRASFEDRETTLSLRMMARIGIAELRDCYALWRHQRGCDPLPRIDEAGALIEGHGDRHFIAAVDGQGEPPRFRLLEVGRALTDRLGGPLDEACFAGPTDDVIGSLPAAYARTARSRLPVYDWLRHSLGDGPAIRFDRLILPMSEDGHTISHLIGIVLFTDFPTDSEAP